MNVLEELDVFYKNYLGEKRIIGRSEKGKDLYCLIVKKTNYPKVIAQYAIHAREYITTYLSFLHIKEFLLNGKVGTVYFIPAVNPDGIKICLEEKPLYKANASGVDLNVNFDALWGMGDSNLKIKGDANYIGPYPFSEKETRALRDLTYKVKPNGTLSFHSKGEVIYYGFNGNKIGGKIADKLSEISGYEKATSIGSVGGYKDWCIQEFNIPAFTIEVGSDNLAHPIKKESLNDIFIKTKDIIGVLTENL